MLRVLGGLVTLFLLSGCELLPTPIVMQAEENTSDECVFLDMDARAPECAINYWVVMWRNASELPWRERRITIEELDSSPISELAKYFYSQPLDTPYQVRLRAQGRFDSLRGKLSDKASSLFEQVVYIPSQQLLEYESAITILSQVNTRQAKRNQEQAQLLLEQEEKINQLLNLEASILEKNLER